MKISKQDTVLSNNIFLPTGSYRVRVAGTEAKTSAKDNPMTVLSCEIVNPEEITDGDGRQVKIAGAQFKLYLVHVPTLVGQQRVSSQGQVLEFMDKVGISDMMETDDEGDPQYETDNHKDYYLGLEFDIILSSEPRIKRLKPNKAKGEKLGKPILDKDGKEIQDGWIISAQLQDVVPGTATRVDMAF